MLNLTMSSGSAPSPSRTAATPSSAWRFWDGRSPPNNTSPRSSSADWPLVKTNSSQRNPWQNGSGSDASPGTSSGARSIRRPSAPRMAYASTAIRSPGETRRGNGTMVSVVRTSGPRARASRPRISHSPRPGSGTWNTTSLTRSERSASTLSSRSRMWLTTAATCARASPGCAACPNASRSACPETAIRRSRRATSQPGAASLVIVGSSRPFILNPDNPLQDIESASSWHRAGLVNADSRDHHAGNPRWSAPDAMVANTERYGESSASPGHD